MHAELLVLRLVHVLGGIFWVGSGLFTTFFLMPALAQAGPATGPVMAGLQRRRLFTALPLVALLTMLSGLRLMWILSGGFSRAYFETAGGLTYGLAGLAAVVAFVSSLAVVRPAAARSAQLGGALAGGAIADAAERERLTAELGRLGRRVAVGSLVAVALLVLAASGMAVARYL